MINKLLDKLILFTLCVGFYIQNTFDPYVVVPVIVALILSAVNSYFENDHLKLFIFAAFSCLGVVVPGFLFFIPLLTYDLLFVKWQWALFLILVPFGALFTKLSVITGILTVLFSFLAFFLRQRTLSIEKIRSEYISLRDAAKELSLKLESKNQELMDKQDYEVNLATLNERNRIAREIHDNVGHLLSSSILQIGALMAVSKEPSLKDNLKVLKETLSKGMNSIRNSVHDLHHESIDLFAETSALIKGFTFCSVSLDFDISENPEKKVKYAFLSILKEALSNIIQHSNATQAHVTLREHPALYQLIIKDNGTKKGEDSQEGIGLKNIEDRIRSLNGTVNISQDKGFVIFISVPKERAV